MGSRERLEGVEARSERPRAFREPRATRQCAPMRARAIKK